ncbi:MAG: hypothetical protein JSS11_05920 [Verrucomicrobia bacterium]|nr:hypothetical protein [Verrucomicrobiota bacterium]
MKRLLLAVVLLLAGCTAVAHRESTYAKPRHCICSIEEVDSFDHKKAGVFLYVDEEGYVSGEIYEHGELARTFGGGTDFNDRLHEAFRKAAIPDIDWSAHFEKVSRATRERTHVTFAVLDGWTQRIQMNFEGSKCDFTMSNPGPNIRHYAGEDELLGRLNALFDVIAVEYGREEMRL